jgi:hypothetical protein
MPKSSFAWLFFLLICSHAVAQTSFTRTLEGRVVNENKGIADVHVMNTSAKKATITDEEGDFTITVRLNDTLLFSAVQFKRKTLVVTAAMLQSTTVFVPLEEFVNELDEVVVRPYDLSGDLGRDMQNMDTGQIVSASTLGLPNADVKPLMQSERQLQQATAGKFHPFMLLNPPIDPLLNAISGRTKMLKKRVARDKKYLRTEAARDQFADSLFVAQLKIPEEKIDDFMYFCEVDQAFDSLVKSDDTMALWSFLLKKSSVYRENNGLD